ncbi:serpin A3-5-like [Nelusetta ayraudi]|uniref:serpin A3-5-like n=1 Tax=Nelusetta ayraudi TaxID=303726 RepID=UPI003F70C982
MHAALKIWIFLAVTCLGRSHHHEGHDQDTLSQSSIESLVGANNNFTFHLYRKLAAHADSAGKNVFFSPASVSLALAALSTGTRGETQRQLFSGLGFNSHTQAGVDQAFQRLLAHKSEEVSQGTAVFVDNKFKAHPEFLEGLNQYYSAHGFNVSFTKTKESEDFINEYVANKTNGKIDKLVENLDPRTVMYLISYIYFKGKWETPFDPELTRVAKFNVAENKKVDVQMMYKEQRFNVYRDLEINASVLHLPFNSSHAMLLMLPEDMNTLENAICPERVTKWLKWMKTGTYEVYIPKFSIKTSYSLKEVLEGMGMTDMFGDRANLTGIAEGKLAVSEVVHQATLDVDEAGATAAAATGVGIMLMSLRHTPVLEFNRPFMAIITERSTNNILFLGKIIDPTI